jgi:hypothetical protein
MSIEEAYKEILKRLKKDVKPNMPAQAKKMRVPYNTVKSLVRGYSLGSIRTWLKIERYYHRTDRQKVGTDEKNTCL